MRIWGERNGARGASSAVPLSFFRRDGTGMDSSQVFGMTRRRRVRRMHSGEQDCTDTFELLFLQVWVHGQCEYSAAEIFGNWEITRLIA